MSNKSFKQIDLLRNRRDETLLLDPYFIDNKKFIKKGIYLGSTLILTVISFLLFTNSYGELYTNNSKSFPWLILFLFKIDFNLLIIFFLFPS